MNDDPLTPGDVEKYDAKARKIIEALKPGESMSYEHALRTAKLLSE